MADFRKWFYALAVVALLAGLTVPASAQIVPFNCTANARRRYADRARGRLYGTGRRPGARIARGGNSDVGRPARSAGRHYSYTEHEHHQQDQLPAHL